AGRDLGFYSLLLNNAGFPFALRARIADHRTRALTARAGARNAEESLLVTDLPAATAGTAGGGSLSLSASRSLAGVAELVPAIRNGLLSAEHGFFEFDGDILAQVGSTLSTRTAAAATALAEDVVEVLENAGIKSAASGSATDTGVPKTVVHAPLFGVGQYGIRLAAFLELLFGVRVVRITVGMVLQRQLAIGALDLLIACAPLDAQYVVIISFYVTRQGFALSRISDLVLVFRVARYPHHGRTQ